jgi:hypothetical protein
LSDRGLVFPSNRPAVHLLPFLFELYLAHRAMFGCSG